MGEKPKELTPDEIRARIADTRDQLAADINRLAARTSPRQIAKSRIRALVGKVRPGRKRGKREADPDGSAERTAALAGQTRLMLWVGGVGAMAAGLALAWVIPQRSHR